LYWFSFFEPLKLGDGAGTSIDGDGWNWPTAPTYPGPVPRSSSYLFRILTPANGTLGVDPEAILNITWERRRGALGYKVQIKNFDTGVEVFSYEKPDRVPSYSLSPSLAVLERSKKYTIKVWAILAKSPEGAATQLEQTTNTRTFNTLLTVPTNLAPVGEIATLTPTFTCDAVTKAVRYKVRIYAADSVTVLHTSSALLLPSYPLGGGVLSGGNTYYFSFTAYADAACTAAYGVESGHEGLNVVQTWLARLTLAEESENTKFPPVPVTMTAYTGNGWLIDGGTYTYSGWRGSWGYTTTSNPAYAASIAVQITEDGDGTYSLRLQRTVGSNPNHWSATYDIGTTPTSWSKVLAESTLTCQEYSA
jgi:hypothetical protein